MKNIPWEEIKNEYISTKTTQRELAKKYKVDPSNISRRSKEEGWVKLREEYSARIQAKALQNIEEAALNFQAQVSESARKLLEKVNELLSLDEALAPRDLKSLSSTLLDLRDILTVHKEDEQDSKNSFTVTWINNPWDDEEESDA